MRRLDRAEARSRVRRSSRTALVCAGGGVTGAVYEIGCLRALEDLLDRSVLDFDEYVGISGGAFVASLLANGFSPRQMYDEVASRSHGRFGLHAAPLFRVGAREYLRRYLRAPRVLRDALVTTLTGEGRNLSDLIFSLLELLPSGLLENSGIEEFLAGLFRDRGRTNDFSQLSRRLYVVAVDLDSGESVHFGEASAPRVSISRAVQASTALPGLYRPVRIAGRDYVDGGVKKTAHINLAIQHGADLVVCLNPIVPILNDTNGGPLRGHLASHGVAFVLDQVLRIMLHARMQYGMERYSKEHPEVDILLIEPMRTDMRMFSYNIMKYSARQVVAEYGYRSAQRCFQKDLGRFRRLLGRHGIRVNDPSVLPEVPPDHPYRSISARTLGDSLDLLGAKLERGRSRQPRPSPAAARARRAARAARAARP